jgi:AcrR family transcriptional regulator
MSTNVKGSTSSSTKSAPRTPPSTPPPQPEASDDPRHAAIRRAAFEAFLENGVAGTTTDEISRRARVSKREIYRLFGSKEALFEALVRERARTMRKPLVLAPPTDRPEALAILERFGREFLTLLIDPTTIAFYRLAMSEAGRFPGLGRELDAQGRGTVRPALIGWMKDAVARGALPLRDIEAAAGSFMALLVGDLTVRLLLNAIHTPTKAEVDRRAALATSAFTRLWLEGEGGRGGRVD